MKKIIGILLVLTLIIPVFGQVKSNVSTKTIQGLRCNVCELTLDETSEIHVAKGKNALIGAENFYEIVKNNKAQVAINGNYFDSYKTLVPMATIIKDGEVWKMVGTTPSFFVFDKNKVKIDNLSLKYKGYLDGKRKNEWNNDKGLMEFNVFDLWYVNVNPTDTAGIFKFTNKYNNELNLRNGRVIEVVKDTVTKIYEPKGKISLPKDGYIIYFGKDSVDKSYIDQRFKLGRKVELVLVDGKGNETFKYNGQDISYSKVTELVAAGPMLLQNGKNVVAESKDNYKEGKINSSTGQRSAIGITKNGKVILLTTVANIDKLALIMNDLGCIDAMNLDGGASSALFANGKVIKNAGRNLNTVLIFK